MFWKYQEKWTAYLILHGQVNGQYKYDTCTLIKQITLISDKKLKVKNQKQKSQSKTDWKRYR
jgi:hypothetical protein